ncbi:MAG TPA: hypothetical protein VIB08_03555 [Thermoanaerobaculia bacterium]
MTALLFLLLQTPVPAPTPITVELDMVRARLSCRYERGGGFFCRPARLEIFREEAPVFEDTFAGVPGYLGRSPDRGPLAAEDLDGNGEPEVLLDLYSGGAHCCSSTRIYFRSGNGRYAMLSHDWGNAGYRLEDFDRDRKLEFLSADDAFSYAFTSYAASRRPPRIWRFEDGRLADVTRRHPKILEEDAASCWKAFAELSPKDPTGDDVRGLAGAYVADQCLLDRCKEGWEKLRAAYDKPDREKFFRELSSLLQKNGYVRRRPLSPKPVR